MHTIGQLKQLTVFVNKHSVYYQALLLPIYYDTHFSLSRIPLWAYVRMSHFTSNSISDSAFIITEMMAVHSLNKLLKRWDFQMPEPPQTPLLGEEGATERLWKPCG